MTYFTTCNHLTYGFMECKKKIRNYAALNELNTQGAHHTNKDSSNGSRANHMRPWVRFINKTP